MKSRPHVVINALQVGGPQTGVALASLEYLAELSQEDRGYRFTVLVGDPSAFVFLAKTKNWQVKVCPQASRGVFKKALFTQWHLPRLLRQLKADVLHSLQFITPLRCSCPVVLTVHDMAWRLHRETIEQPRRQYYRFLVPRCLQRADAILTNSATTAQDVRRCLPGLSAKITVTPFGTPTWLAKLPVAGGVDSDDGPDPYFLFVGTLEPRKNLGNLLKAFAEFLTLYQERYPGGESCQIGRAHV